MRVRNIAGRLSGVIIAIALASGAGSIASGSLLSDLILPSNHGQPAGTLQTDGMSFDNFTAIQTGNITTNFINRIEVTATESPLGGTVLRFQPTVGDNILEAVSTGGITYGDLVIRFRVRAALEDLVGIDLAYNGSAPNGIMSQVVETVSAPGFWTQMHVDTHAGSYAHLDLGGRMEYQITKDAAVVAAPGQTANIAWIEQRFTPEPAGLALAGLGAGWLLRRRKRQKGWAAAAVPFSVWGGVLFVLSAASTGAWANPITLDPVGANPGSITVGPFTFSNFSYTATLTSDPGNPSSGALAGQLQVDPSALLSREGIQFSGLLAAWAGGTLVANVAYDITVEPGKDIVGGYMQFNGTVNGSNSSASVEKTLSAGSNQWTIEVYNTATPPGLVPEDEIQNLPHITPTLHVVDVISLNGGTADATISTIDQTFNWAPEPTAGLLLLAGMGLLPRRARR